MAAKHLDQPQAAELAGVSTRRMNQLSKENDPPIQDENGSYPCLDYGKWLKRRAIAGLGVTSDGQVYDYEAERARLTHHQANNAALDEDTKRGVLIPSERVERVWGDMIGAFRARCLSLPTKAAQTVMAAADLAEAESILKDLIYEALSELADYDTAHYRVGAESGEASSAAAKADDKPVGRQGKTPKQRGKRRARPVEH